MIPFLLFELSSGAAAELADTAVVSISAHEPRISTAVQESRVSVSAQSRRVIGARDE